MKYEGLTLLQADCVELALNDCFNKKSRPSYVKLLLLKVYVILGTRGNMGLLCIEPYTQWDMSPDESGPQQKIAIVSIFFTLETVELILSKFHCKRCGHCYKICNVNIQEQEIYSAASFLHTRPRRIRRLIKSDGLLPSPCPFLKSKNNCSIYPVRPMVCRSYPLIPYLTPEHDKELPVIGIVLCAGGLILFDKVKADSEKLRNILLGNDQLRVRFNKIASQHRQQVKEQIIVVSPKAYNFTP